MNILIATPGRLLQHMDETPGFYVSDVQVFVLDEADRMLDLGFKKTLDSIIDSLPKTRQTLLFSATQTKSVSKLRRLGLYNPEYIWAIEGEDSATPDNLIQKYAVVELKHKIDVVWSFIATHKKSKTIIFFSSCKEVAFLGEAFQHLRPGVSLLFLHGRMKQMKRFQIFARFCEMEHAVLITTDIAARGLDVPTVDWILQADCPEDADTYIHRAGRTARYKSGGKALLLLLPSEEKEMVKQLKDKKIPISQTSLNTERIFPISGKLSAILARFPSLQETAQKAIMSYTKFVHLAPNKKVFDESKLDLAGMAKSMGLALIPMIETSHSGDDETDGEESESGEKKENGSKTKGEQNEEDSAGTAEEDDESEANEAEGRSWKTSTAHATSSVKVPKGLLSGKEREEAEREEKLREEKKRRHNEKRKKNIALLKPLAEVEENAEKVKKRKIVGENKQEEEDDDESMDEMFEVKKDSTIKIPRSTLELLEKEEEFSKDKKTYLKKGKPAPTRLVFGDEEDSENGEEGSEDKKEDEAETNERDGRQMADKDGKVKSSNISKRYDSITSELKEKEKEAKEREKERVRELHRKKKEKMKLKQQRKEGLKRRKVEVFATLGDASSDEVEADEQDFENDDSDSNNSDSKDESEREED
eukprot:MONOS_3346.1-p1 / transcript=MONOS_3346.1 / gene=MONOS_3346 / organism=Monocercomonoides_exilis_PA203 / gene_product=DEAD / transcript_product=DEAD / location=Mono_scaffold00078:41838-44964(-) / protein_length=646 / sequence_SO=supercontig / SO=protein_coding / is_pseudo=false